MRSDHLPSRSRDPRDCTASEPGNNVDPPQQGAEQGAGNQVPDKVLPGGQDAQREREPSDPDYGEVELPAGEVGGTIGETPYTPLIFDGRDPKVDVKNPNSKRQAPYKNVNLLLTKAFNYYGLTVNMGLNIQNVFNFLFRIIPRK